MKKVTLLSAALLLSFFSFCNAQFIERYVLPASGTSFNISNAHGSYTIGEALITTLTSSSGVMTQGFEQPDMPQTNEILRLNNGSFNFNLFPNPAINHCSMLLTGTVPAGTKILLVDQLGRELWKEAAKAGVTEIPVESLPSGMYFVQLKSNENTIITTQKLIKLQ